MAEDDTRDISISQDQFAQLMGAIGASQTRMDDKFAEFQAEVRRGQEDAAAKALKRVRYEKPYEYRRKGNEEQATFNAKLDEVVAEAETQLEEAGPSLAPALQRAKEALKSGRQLIAERQKLIKIADRSEHGWGVVSEYTTDVLADDSGDEKRLEKAEKAAEQKAAKRRKKQASSAQGAGKSRNQPRVVVPAAAPPYHLPSSRRLAGATVTPGCRITVPCFACGEMGPSAGKLSQSRY